MNYGKTTINMCDKIICMYRLIYVMRAGRVCLNTNRAKTLAIDKNKEY